MKPTGLISATLLLLALGAWPLAWAEDPFMAAVQLYRSGQYAEAEKQFAGMHAAQPEDVRVTYYLAMTEAQLGRYQQARSLYQQVLLLDPQGEAAALAQQGLQYLPSDNPGLDMPPRFQVEAPAPAGQAPAPGTTQAATTPTGMSPQDMMMWQMMMSSMGSQNGSGGMNPWMMAMPGMQGGQMDPSAMSTMLMNQMMSDFNFSNDDRDR